MEVRNTMNGLNNFDRIENGNTKLDKSSIKLLHSKGNHTQNEKTPTEQEKIFSNKVINKGLISKIQIAHAAQFQKTNNPIKKWA